MPDARRGRPHLRALIILAGQVRYGLRLLLRTPMSAFGTIIVPLMVLLAVGLLYDDTRVPSRGGIRYIQFLAPAMVAFATIAACYMATISSVVAARELGILKRLRSTPLPPWLYMAGRGITSALVAFVSSVLVMVAATGVYGFTIVWSAVPAALAVSALAVVTFTALGLAVTRIVPRAEAAMAVAWGTMLPLCFVSDVFQPIDGTSPWLRAVVSAFPVRPFADELEYLFDPVHGGTALHGRHLVVMGLWCIGALLAAGLSFRWEPGSASPPRIPWHRHTHPVAPLSPERRRELLSTRSGGRTRA